MHQDDLRTVRNLLRDKAVLEAEVLRLRDELRTIAHVAGSQTMSAPMIIPSICEVAIAQSRYLFPGLEDD